MILLAAQTFLLHLILISHCRSTPVVVSLSHQTYWSFSPNIIHSFHVPNPLQHFLLCSTQPANSYNTNLCSSLYLIRSIHVIPHISINTSSPLHSIVFSLSFLFHVSSLYDAVVLHITFFLCLFQTSYIKTPNSSPFLPYFMLDLTFTFIPLSTLVCDPKYLLLKQLFSFSFWNKLIGVIHKFFSFRESNQLQL